MSISKFRPSFSKEEINFLISILSKESELLAEKINKQLKLMMVKVDNELISPAYSASPSSRDQLMSPDSPETRRHIAYLKWKTNPGNCSSEELDAANMYRYLQNLMSQEEIEVYEKEMF